MLAYCLFPFGFHLLWYFFLFFSLTFRQFAQFVQGGELELGAVVAADVGAAVEVEREAL